MFPSPKIISESITILLEMLSSNIFDLSDQQYMLLPVIMKRPLPAQNKLAARSIVESVATWRKLIGLTFEELATKVGVSRATVYRPENDDSSVSLATYFNVCRALGVLDRVIDASDPYDTDLGRFRADQRLPQRVRKPS